MNGVSNATNSLSVRLKRKNDAVHFAGEQGTHTVHIDGPSELGGQDKGFRPTELFLYAVGGCAILDFASMLYRQGIAVKDIFTDISGTRQPEGAAKPFSTIKIKFIIVGEKHELETHRNIIQLFAKRSVRELCSVGLTVRKETAVSYEIEFSYT